MSYKKAGILLYSLWYLQNQEQCLAYSRYSTDVHGRKKRARREVEREKGREQEWEGGREGDSEHIWERRRKE